MEVWKDEESRQPILALTKNVNMTAKTWWSKDEESDKGDYLSYFRILFLSGHIARKKK